MSLKTTLHALLSQGDLSHIAELAAERKRVLPALVSLTYDSDSQIAWRAVEAVGVAAAAISDDDPGFVREHLRRLQWLISEESGGVCWHAPEAMAEIVRNRPQLFSDYIPIVVTLIETIEPEDLEHFRPGALRAIGRLADVAADHVGAVMTTIESALGDRDSQARGMAVWCVDQLGATSLLADKPQLQQDQGPVELYQNGALVHTTVAELYHQAIAAHSV
jgi:methylated-DNA-[protein]-cysteine S-methyltransferase